MTATAKRNLRLAISAVLSKHGIDDMAIEMDLTEGIHKLFMDHQRGKPLTEARVDLLSEYEKAHPKIQERAQMVVRIEESLRITPLDTTAWNDAITFLLARDKDGETIEQFGRFMRENVYTMPKEHQILKDPAIIRGNWRQVFPRQSGEKVELEEGRGFKF